MDWTSSVTLARVASDENPLAHTPRVSALTSAMSVTSTGIATGSILCTR